MVVQADNPQGTAVQAPPDWYQPGPSILEFHRCTKRYRILIGGRGSGKTTAIAVEAIGHCFKNAGARVYILRKTEASNRDTTLETFEMVFEKMGTAYADTGTSLFKKIDGGRVFRIPSAKAVELYNEFMRSRPNKSAIVQWLETVGNRWCSFIQFAGVPTANVKASRFRGFECSLLILVEADQFDREDVELATACLRWKSPDKSVCDERGYIRNMGMILDTNPPSPRHWIAEWEEDSTKLEDPDIKFWHIKTEENSQNLPPGYVDDLKRIYAKNPAMLKRMVYGEYADAFSGKPVLWAFREDHVFDDLPWPKGAYLVRGWDFGTTHAIVWSAYWLEWLDERQKYGVEYWWDLHEYFAVMSDTETQCRRAIEITNSAFPFWNDRNICAGVLDYCDIAGNQRKDTGRSISILNSFGIYPGYSRLGLQHSIAIYNRLLEKRDNENNFVYRIDRKNCPRLYEASCGGYRYPNVNEPGYGSNEPGKGPEFGDYDHVADASRYAKLNALRLLKAEADPAPVRGILARPTKVNGPRKWI